MPRSKKKPKMDLEELSLTVWEHYRNYLDSCQRGDQDDDDHDGEGDIDELQEIIELVTPHASTLKTKRFLDTTKKNNNQSTIANITSLLPIVISVAHHDLADAAILDYLQQPTDDMARVVQDHLIESLSWFPENAGTWSMGANFGRMSQRLGASQIVAWYEQAVQNATKVRQVALQYLQDDDDDDNDTTDQVKEWVELLLLNQVLGVEYVSTNDDNDDDENKEEHEHDDGYYSASAVEATARFMCATLWSTAGQHDRALEHLKHFHLSHRLHPHVWQPPSLTMTLDEVAPTTAPLAFRPSEGILPPDLLQSMCTVFGPDAAYWKESDYSNRGYFSYFMDFTESHKQHDYQPKNLLEQVIIHHLLPRAKQVLPKEDGDAICGFEWWAHTRPIRANVGHNLHFDTDEAILAQEGLITHPILSSVLYLTGGCDGAGATVLLNQTPDSETNPDWCWKAYPQDNSFLLFPGNLLHGVLPCEGVKRANDNSMSTFASDPKQLMHQWNQLETTGKSSLEPRHRLTFMVGFWTRNVPAKMKERRLYGPCGPLPPATDDHTWVREIEHAKTPTKIPAPVKMETTALPKISPAWEVIESSIKEDNLQKPESILQIPKAIDHRFFVRNAPKCFRDGLLEDRGEECS